MIISGNTFSCSPGSSGPGESRKGELPCQLLGCCLGASFS